MGTTRTNSKRRRHSRRPGRRGGRQRQQNPNIQAIRANLPQAIGLFLVTGVIAWFAFAAAVGEVLLRPSPMVAERVGIANDEQAALRETLLRVASEEYEGSDPRIHEAGRNAYMAQPLNPQALVAMSTQQLQAEENQRATVLAELGQQFTRRNLGIQLILFQTSVISNDVDAALDHLDVGLRTTGSTQNALFELMTRALAAPEFKNGLVPIIERGHEWTTPFLIYAVDRGGAAVQIADMYLQLEPDARQRLSEKMSGRLATRLAALEEYGLARQVIRSLPDVSDSTLSNLALTNATIDTKLGIFGWTPGTTEGIAVQFTRNESGGSPTLLTETRTGANGLAASRLVMLPPGNYAFSARVRDVGNGADVQPEWRIRCINEDTLSDTWTSDDGPQFRIPANCPMQLVQLVLSNPGETNYAQIEFTNIAARRR